MSAVEISLVKSPGRADRTDARASEFLVRRYDCGRWNDADQDELDAWFAESLSHRTSYWRLKAAWVRANRLDALRPASSLDEPAGMFRRLRPTMKFTAAIAILLVVGGTAWLERGPATQTFSTKIGERKNLRLADGSHVELTTNTVLRVADSAGHRKVWLDRGEAFFKVVHDSDRPFELHALDFRVIDLGTEFAVRRDADRILVTVLKGSVRLEPSDQQTSGSAVRLIAGDTALASGQSISVSKKSAAELTDALSWRSGALVFRRAPLSTVAAEFNRYNNEKLMIDDSASAELTVSARLPAADVDAFARMARNFMGLQVRHINGEIHISR